MRAHSTAVSTVLISESGDKQGILHEHAGRTDLCRWVKLIQQVHSFIKCQLGVCFDFYQHWFFTYNSCMKSTYEQTIPALVKLCFFFSFSYDIYLNLTGFGCKPGPDLLLVMWKDVLLNSCGGSICFEDKSEGQYSLFLLLVRFFFSNTQAFGVNNKCPSSTPQRYPQLHLLPHFPSIILMSDRSSLNGKLTLT